MLNNNSVGEATRCLRAYVCDQSPSPSHIKYSECLDVDWNRTNMLCRNPNLMLDKYRAQIYGFVLPARRLSQDRSVLCMRVLAPKRMSI